MENTFDILIIICHWYVLLYDIGAWNNQLLILTWPKLWLLNRFLIIVSSILMNHCLLHCAFKFEACLIPIQIVWHNYNAKLSKFQSTIVFVYSNNSFFCVTDHGGPRPHTMYFTDTSHVSWRILDRVGPSLPCLFLQVPPKVVSEFCIV